MPADRAKLYFEIGISWMGRDWSNCRPVEITVIQVPHLYLYNFISLTWSNGEIGQVCWADTASRSDEFCLVRDDGNQQLNAMLINLKSTAVCRSVEWLWHRTHYPRRDGFDFYGIHGKPRCSPQGRQNYMCYLKMMVEENQKRMEVSPAIRSVNINKYERIK